MQVNRIERGWAGHFILAHRCLFRRNTLLEYEGTKVVVSTVGLMRNKSGSAFEEIGVGRYYETMAFHVDPSTKFLDADVTKPVDFDSCWTISELDGEVEANIMHESIVTEISEKLINGNC